MVVGQTFSKKQNETSRQSNFLLKGESRQPDFIVKPVVNQTVEFDSCQPYFLLRPNFILNLTAHSTLTKLSDNTHAHTYHLCA